MATITSSAWIFSPSESRTPHTFFCPSSPGSSYNNVSQISKDHVEKPADVLKIGQEIEAKVVDFNEDDKKISLSIKALEAPEEDAVEAAEVHTEE